MGLSVKNAEVERMLREVAGRRGVGMTEALRQVLAEEVERSRGGAGGGGRGALRAVMAIARGSRRCPTSAT